MTAKSRTIDNLGIDASIRYAQDQKLFESKFIEESQLVSKRSEISVSKPYVPSEFDQMLGLGKPLIWAAFAPPPRENAAINTLFSYQLIPSLHMDDDNHADLEEVVQHAFDEQREQNPDSSDQEKEQEEKEKQLLLNLVTCLSKINQSLQLINSRRNQYQRG